MDGLISYKNGLFGGTTIFGNIHIGSGPETLRLKVGRSLAKVTHLNV